jgi:hypothetical protein
LINGPDSHTSERRFLIWQRITNVPVAVPGKTSGHPPIPKTDLGHEAISIVDQIRLSAEHQVLLNNTGGQATLEKMERKSRGIT